MTDTTSASAGSDSKTATSSDAANTIRITLLATTSLNNVPFDDSYDMADTSKATGKPSFELIAVINEGFKGSGLTARFVIQGKDLGRDKTWTELGVKSGDSVPTILWGRGG